MVFCTIKKYLHLKSKAVLFLYLSKNLRSLGIKFSQRMFKLNHLSTIRIIVLFYVAAVIGSTILLSFPFFHHEGITVASMLCTIAVILLIAVESFPLLSIIFEVSSAFGTTGLSMEITPELSIAGKSIIIFLMFVGRIGIFSFLFIIRGDSQSDKYHYPKEKVIIG